jgi:phosphatidylserine decarboxylase
MAYSCSRHLARAPTRTPLPSPTLCHARINAPSRAFSSSRTAFEEQNFHRKESFRSRLNSALKKTKIKWEPIPIALGVGFLGAFQLYRIQRREKHTEAGANKDLPNEVSVDSQGRPKKRERIRPSGPWSVPCSQCSSLYANMDQVCAGHVHTASEGCVTLMGTVQRDRHPILLPCAWLQALLLHIRRQVSAASQRTCIILTTCSLSEVSEPDLHVYPNLAAFFYRTLKPGVRPLDPDQNAILSPADGKVIQFGTIEHGEVEQVKGVTYSLDALLGSVKPSKSETNKADSQVVTSSTHDKTAEEDVVRADEEFAQVNGITYTLPNLFSGPWPKGGKPAEMPTDQSTAPAASSEAEVRADLALSEAERPWWAPAHSKTPTALYYCVIYLAPGDYHRFHSPVSWVVESRRHFAGELYSVSPFLQRRMPGLFTLNERVVLLGRWRWGFFSYTPVGATNVGSIKINFDRELRTNSLTTDTAADRAAEQAAERGEPYSGFAEASYTSASSVLGGHSLKRGEEMGGFQLGSTIVLVFEAPKGIRPTLDEGYAGSRQGGFKWNIEQGMKVKVGEALGAVEEP